MEEIQIQNSNIDVLTGLIPRLGNQVRDTWGTRECRDFLINLIADSRDGTRQGFPFATASIIIQLLQDHDDSYPQFDNSKQS